MQYNGVDINAVHKLVSLSSALPPALKRDIRTIEAGREDLPGYGRTEAGEYEIVVNIAGRTVEDGNKALQAVRDWAFGTGGMAELIPHEDAGFAYDAMLASVDDADMQHGFGTCRVAWRLESVHKRSLTEKTAETTESSRVLLLDVEGTAYTYGVFEVTPADNAQTLQIELDGTPLVLRSEATEAGSTLVIDTRYEQLTLNGRDVRAETDWTRTDYDRPIRKGRHELSCNVPARMKARWFDRWA